MAKQTLMKSVEARKTPEFWSAPATSTENTLHQLAPYIGKLKSSIAADLIRSYSNRNDLVVDPFAGSGTIPLEALALGRRSFGADISPYAAMLTKAKTGPLPDLAVVLEQVDKFLAKSVLLPDPDLRKIPRWVRSYFHPRTLKEVYRFVQVCKENDNSFLLACTLGILHHQRPGFLSYPSSHLVPYLRTKKFPRDLFPEMYSYRDLRSRLVAKVMRALSRVQVRPRAANAEFTLTPIESTTFPREFDSIITSPPYMNALDYGRDNRLRLWFLGEETVDQIDIANKSPLATFSRQIAKLASEAERGLSRRGTCVLVVGETVRRSSSEHPAEVVVGLISTHAPSLKLDHMIVDEIPDVRRSRRDKRGVKREVVLVFQKAHRFPTSMCSSSRASE
jgi:hypothetical protein